MRIFVPRLMFRLLIPILCLSLLFPAQAFTSAQARPEVVIHSFNAVPQEGKYQQNVYFSAFDSDGTPLRTVKASDFAFREDQKPLESFRLESAQDEPLTVVLVMDVGASMLGKIETARAAAGALLDRLTARDYIALVTFHNQYNEVLGIGQDLKVARDQLNSLRALPDGGSCLFDAAQRAVQIAGSASTPRKLVVLLSSRVDQKLQGGACSKATREEVAVQASQPEKRIPIFTIGLEKIIDEPALQSLANRTGGRYYPAASPQELARVFERIANDLNAQLVLRYTTTPGRHALNIEFQQGAKPFASLEYETRLLPASTPVPGITPSITLTPTITPTGTITPATKTITPSLTPRITSTSPTVAVPPECSGLLLLNEFCLNWVTLAIICLGSLLALALTIAGIVALVSRRRIADKTKTPQKTGPVLPPPSNGQASDRTMDQFSMDDGAVGTLTLLRSDDPEMENKVFRLVQFPLRIGRVADNDIALPKDRAVSRHHARLTLREGQVYIEEVASPEADGSLKRPTFGTYVNEVRLGESAEPLLSGAEIRLGTRARLRFDQIFRTLEDGGRTVDGIVIPSTEEPEDLTKTIPPQDEAE